jgi:hypothetical protein
MPPFTAGAGGVKTVETCVSAAAELRPTTRTRRRYIAASATVNIGSVPLFICRVVYLLLRQRRGAAGDGLGTTIKYLRHKTSCAAGNGLVTTIKYLRRTASGAADKGLGTTAK